MRPDIETVRAIFADAKESGDGAIKFACPECEAEGRPGEEFTVFANGATSCRRAGRAGRDFNREHCRWVREALGLGREAEPGFIVETLFNGTLTLLCDLARSSRALTIARNRNDDLLSDEINLNQADAREKFVRRLVGFDAFQKEEIGKALLRLAARRRETRKVVKDGDGGETVEYVTFKELSDGRLIEQINDGRFVIYDGSGVDYSDRVECDGVTYVPITGDPCIEDNDLHLPDQVSEFGDEAALDKQIEEYLARFCDAPARELQFAAKLIRLTYVQDKLNEVPYLHIVGPSGSGKTRMSDVVGMACHRPYLIVEGSAASTFRISDKFSVTMCFDEFNPVTDSEDQQALIQILNAGFQRRRKVPRVEKGPNGEFVTRSFRPYGVKIFSGLKLTQSYAFQRRTIPIQLSVTTNQNIPYCDDGLIEELSGPLREKLTLWRLRNWHRDYRSLLRQTETVFKAKKIHPGFIQIGAPMAMLIEDTKLRDEFVSTMENRTEDAKEDRRQTFDGQIVAWIHSRLFDTLEDGAVSWKVEGDLPELVEGEPCEGLRIEFLADILNQDLPEKKKLLPQRYGTIIRSLGFRTRELTRGVYRKKYAVVFCRNAFARVFNSFSLAVPADFVPASPATEAKPNNGNEMRAPARCENDSPEKNSSGARISLDTNDLSHVAGDAGTDFQETEGGETRADCNCVYGANHGEHGEHGEEKVKNHHPASVIPEIPVSPVVCNCVYGTTTGSTASTGERK